MSVVRPVGRSTVHVTLARPLRQLSIFGGHQTPAFGRRSDLWLFGGRKLARNQLSSSHTQVMMASTESFSSATLWWFMATVKWHKFPSTMHLSCESYKKALELLLVSDLHLMVVRSWRSSVRFKWDVWMFYSLVEGYTVKTPHKSRMTTPSERLTPKTNHPRTLLTDFMGQIIGKPLWADSTLRKWYFWYGWYGDGPLWVRLRSPRNLCVWKLF